MRKSEQLARFIQSKLIGNGANVVNEEWVGVIEEAIEKFESSPSTLAADALACGVCGRKIALVCTECAKNYMHPDVRR